MAESNRLKRDITATTTEPEDHESRQHLPVVTKKTESGPSSLSTSKQKEDQVLKQEQRKVHSNVTPISTDGPSLKKQFCQKEEKLEDLSRRAVARIQDTSLTSSSESDIEDRRNEPNASHGIQPLLSLQIKKRPRAVSALPQTTPRNFTHHLISEHPWAKYVTVRDRPLHLSEDCVTSSLPLEVYRHIPETGYLSNEFVRSLFPHHHRKPSRAHPLPIFELMRLQDAIDFREDSLNIIHQLQDGRYEPFENKGLKTTPQGSMATCVLPVPRYNRPVLYQVVSRECADGVILEAKDFFIVGPDRGELQCIVLDQSSTNIKSNTRGFDRQLVSVKDFVWVYSVEPTAEALQNPSSVLVSARSPRTTALDTHVPYFFRVREFVFITPPGASRQVYGIVLKDANENLAFEVAFESVPDAVTVSPSVYQGTLRKFKKDEVVRAETRTNVSTAIRFSESPASVADQLILCNLIRGFIPSHPQEGLLPLKISDIKHEDREWILDRTGRFTNYSRNSRLAHVKLGPLFNVGCSALLAIEGMNDDKCTRRVTAAVPSMTAFPIRFQFDLKVLTVYGWNANRSVLLWIVGASAVVRVSIESSKFDSTEGILSIRLVAPVRSHNSLMKMIKKFSRKEEGKVYVDACVKLSPFISRNIPVYQIVSRNKLFSNILKNNGCRAEQVLDAVYNHFSRYKHDRIVHPHDEKGEKRLSFNGKHLKLDRDQVSAIRLGCEDHPIVAIRGGSGTGKTLVGALIAARTARQQKGFVIVVATTNGAVAQITNTILKLEKYRHLPVLRYVADTSLVEGNPSTAVDINEVLKSLPDKHAPYLSPEEMSTCMRFKKGRELLERYLFAPEKALFLSESEQKEYRLAEKDISTLTSKVVNLMFTVRIPAIICMTTSALLNTTEKGAIFHNLLTDCHTIIGDNASHISEPEFVAIANRFYRARHVYIGDPHQLRPHIRCLRLSLPALLGARDVIQLLLDKGVPFAFMTTTYRAHPELNDLLNSVFYRYGLSDGVTMHERSLLLKHVCCKNPYVPFVFVDVPVRSELSPSGSHYNHDEAKTCRKIVTSLLAKGIQSDCLTIITYYRQQLYDLEEFAKENSVELLTVGSFQSRENDIVILLTTRSNDGKVIDDEYIDDPHRLNVALTRCRHGLFVLGNREFLKNSDNWSAVIKWAEGNGAIISRDNLPCIFA